MGDAFESFREKHFGKYPTVFIDLNMKSPRSAAEVEKILNELVAKLFVDDFGYLGTWLVSVVIHLLCVHNFCFLIGGEGEGR